MADLQEADLDAEGARRTWTDLVARFPRDPAALLKAAAFFERSEDPSEARRTAAAAVALDGTDLPGILRLAALEDRAGDPVAAFAAYQSVLDRTPPEPADAPFTPPEELRTSMDPMAGLGAASGGFRLRTVSPALLTAPAVATPAGDGDQASRLRAIAGASRLLASGQMAPAIWSEKRAAWLARWRKAAEVGAVNEPSHAFFYGDAKDETMHLLARRLEGASSEDATLAGAFVLAGCTSASSRRSANGFGPGRRRFRGSGWRR